jgi:hypothetical protein
MIGCDAATLIAKQFGQLVQSNIRDPPARHSADLAREER